MFLASSIRSLSRRLDGLDVQLGRYEAAAGQEQGGDEDREGKDEDRERRRDDGRLIERVRSLEERVASVHSDNEDRLKIQHVLDEDIVLPMSTLEKDVVEKDGVVNSALKQQGYLTAAVGDLEEVRKRMAILDNFKVSAVEMKSAKDKLDELEMSVADAAKKGESQTDRVNQLVAVYKQFVHVMSKKSLEWDAKLRQQGY